MTATLPDAPVTTVDDEGDQARRRQDLPRTKLWARLEQVELGAFIAVPLTAVPASGFVLRRGPACRCATWWSAPSTYAVTGHGLTVRFHRSFTHGSSKAGTRLRVALAIAGSMAIEGPVTRAELVRGLVKLGWHTTCAGPSLRGSRLGVW